MMADHITGNITAVSIKNKSFKMGQNWYRLGKDIEVDIQDLKKGDAVTIEYNPSEHDGFVTNWVNMLNFENGSGAHGSGPSGDPRDETPPVGKYPSKEDMNKTDFNILFGMCFNNVSSRAATDKSWKQILEETEDLTVKVLVSREDLWKRLRSE